MEIHFLMAAISGLVGAIILTLLIYLLPIFDYDLDIPYLIGSRFVDIQNTKLVYTVGIIAHLLVGAGWGILYVILLTAMVVTPNWPAGILWGFAHGIFVGAMMGILADTHPNIGKGKAIAHPGIMGRRWGAAMPYFILGFHIIFGVCAMTLYHYLVLG
ncbi:hypothetical protein LX73_2190 [Fodinibius salinus]|uniref:Uncharacterized protein n=1 Tax=Fodinibius salinus TaxID=860790 RepID=A0A5D3YER0_9BACT|nr:hypothetical protein [Fodinibius salinus]TYP91947.1 hypothetical protein LX73_2190 [Fodinibius salinus]